MKQANYPEPIFSANVYCSGRIDEVICRVLAPFWSNRGPEHGSDAYIWLMRYAKTGEHLKIRLHGNQGGEALIEPLCQGLDRYFATLPAETGGVPRKSLSTATPIDLEDNEAKDHHDRSWQRTHYRRSAISFGYSPYVDDDVWVSLATRALAAGTEFIFERLVVGDDGRAPHKLVQGMLIQAILVGLGALGFDEPQRGAYLVYHRDWLLRAALKQSSASAVGPEKMAEVIERFHRQTASLGHSALEGIRKVAHRRWNESDLKAPRREGVRNSSPPDALDGWQTTLERLRDHVGVVSLEPRRNIDPFAGDIRFAPFFKVFHGFANQLGLNPLNEAFAYHLVLQAAIDDPELRQQPVTLRPRL